MIDGLIINQQLNPALPGFTFQVIICDYKFHNHHNHEQSIIYHPQSPFTSIVLIYIAYIADLYCLYCVDLVLIYIYCADCADLYCVTIVSHLLYGFYLRLSNLRGTNIQKLPFIYIDSPSQIILFCWQKEFSEIFLQTIQFWRNLYKTIFQISSLY